MLSLPQYGPLISNPHMYLSFGLIFPLLLWVVSFVGFVRTAPSGKGGEKIEKLLTHSSEEVAKLLKQGYKLDSVAYSGWFKAIREAD